jgi:hypothetical protein
MVGVRDLAVRRDRRMHGRGCRGGRLPHVVRTSL